MPEYLTVSEVARQLGVAPREVSDLFYARKLRDDLCPVHAGRRMIPPDYVPQIRAALKRSGRPVADVSAVANA